MTTTKEDQIRAEFEAQNGYPVRSGTGYYREQNNNKWKLWKACAESYEKKLAELPKSVITHDEWYALCNQLEAAQLHIKELREAIEQATVTSGMLKIRELLAKQPDTCALDKAMLEAEINVLKLLTTTEWPENTPQWIKSREAKLAELNKAEP